MKKPGDMVAPAAKPGPKGRFLGLVATGRERYQVVMMETVGDQVTKREVLDAGRADVVNGVPLTGNSLHVALAQLNVYLQKRLRDVASELWK